MGSTCDASRSLSLSFTPCSFPSQPRDWPLECINARHWIYQEHTWLWTDLLARFWSYPLSLYRFQLWRCKDTHRLTSGYVFITAGKAVTWSSKCQATMALSTVKAEYVAMSQCMQQMVWMHNWLDEVNIQYTCPGLIKGDNCGVTALTKNTKDHGKVKHINIWHHYIHNLIQSGNIIVEEVPFKDNLADLFTKPLPCDHHHRILASLNIQWSLLHL